MRPARVDVVALDLPTAAEVVLSTELPAVVVRALAMGRRDGADGQSEAGGRAERGAARLQQRAARNGVGQVGQEGGAVVVGGDDRRRLREAGLVAGVEVV